MFEILAVAVLIGALLAVGREWLLASRRADYWRAKCKAAVEVTAARERRRANIEAAVRRLREGKDDVIVAVRDGWSLFVRRADLVVVEGCVAELPSAPDEVLARQAVKRLNEPRPRATPRDPQPVPWESVPESGRQYVGPVRRAVGLQP